MGAKKSRRTFLKTTLAAGATAMAAPYFVPARALGRDGNIAPSDKVIFGAIGTGSRSFSDTGELKKLEDVEFAAVCDVELTRAQNDAGPRRLNLRDQTAIYQDYHKLLDRKDIDAVVIASPDHWHAQLSVEAMLSGKDVYVEKAMTLTVNEGRVMVNAARKNNRVVQVGSQQRSSSNFFRACMLIRNGLIGKITKVVAVNFAGAWECKLPAEAVPATLDWNMWMGQVDPKPFSENIRTSRSKPGWLSIKDFCGGEICGWGAHDLDQVQWALGHDLDGPSEVWVEGQPFKPWIATDGSRTGRFFGPQETIIHYMYPDGVHVECSENAVPNGGALFIGEKGQIRIDRSKFEVPEPDMKTMDLSKLPIQLHTAKNHYRNFVDCIKNKEKTVADVEIGHRSSTMLHMGNIARWVSEKNQTVGDKLKWDVKSEKFTNSELANSMLERPRRKGFELPKV